MQINGDFFLVSLIINYHDHLGNLERVGNIVSMDNDRELYDNLQRVFFHTFWFASKNWHLLLIDSVLYGAHNGRRFWYHGHWT